MANYYNEDASNVSYISPNGTTVQRGLNVKLTEVLSVADYGADSTGAVDSTAAFTNALAAAGSKVLFVPQGIYLINGTVTPSSINNMLLDSAATFSGSGSINLTACNLIYAERNFSSTAGTQMRVQKQYSQGTDVKNLAYLWGGTTAAYFGVGKRFDSGYTSSPAGSPYAAIASWATDNGSGADVCATLNVVEVLTNNGIGFGGNLIATNAAGNTNTKLVGLEIDLEPTSGTTVNSGSAGLYVNAFNLGSIGPVMQVGGVSGGTFSNGILMNAIASGGSAVAAQSGLSCTNFINTVSGGFSGAAIQLGNSQGIGWTAGAAINGDGSGNLNINPASAVLVNGNNTTEGNTLMVVRDSGSVAALQVFVARGSAANGANAAIKVNGQSATGRSINAGGTINASGADYAEYEVKRNDCQAIEKGQIVGFDADGKLTDKFSLAIRFGVKSTSPNLVGGDTWHQEEKPVAPDRPEDLRPCPVKHDAHQRYGKHKAAIDAEHLEQMKVWEQEKAAYNLQMQEYETKLDLYAKALLAWEKSHEEARQEVDRIAYCGKVPVNVFGGLPGQYLVPVANGDSISGIFLDKNSLSFAQYLNAVGVVNRVLVDGRAEIVVKTV